MYNDVTRYQTTIENNEVKQLSKKDQKVCKKVIQIIDNYITKDMSKYKKTKVIHDYIVKHTTYDYDNYLANTLEVESIETIGA